MPGRRIGGWSIVTALFVGLGCGPGETPPCTDCEAACDEGWADCNGDAADGCEALLSSSKDACGACGVHCGDLPGALAAECVEGQCQVYGCAPGFGDCNQDPSDGCEVDTTKTAEHCGACGNDCNAVDMAHSTSAACVAGECTVSCKAGFFDCNEDPADGCEADISTSSAHCGACFQDCIIGPCAGGRCLPITVVPSAGVPVDVAVIGVDLYWVDTASTTGALRRVFAFTQDAGPADIEAVVEDQPTPIGLTVDNDFLYWTTWGDGLVHRRRRDKSGSNEVVGGGPYASPTGISVGGGSLYWAEFDAMGKMKFGVYRMSLDTGMTDKLQSPAAAVSDVAIAKDALYWAEPATGVLMADPDPMSAVAATLGGVAPSFLAIDETHVYFTEGKSVKRVARDLSTQTVEVVTTVENNTNGVSLDPYFVYFASRDPMSAAPGKIHRVRKPW